MLGLIVLLALLAIGFGAGYGTREIISRRRHAAYLKYEPYVASERHRKQPPRVAGSRGTDITHSFQDLEIKGGRRASPNLHLVHSRRPRQPPTEDLEHLLSRLQSGRTDNSAPKCESNSSHPRSQMRISRPNGLEQDRLL